MTTICRITCCNHICQVILYCSFKQEFIKQRHLQIYNSTTCLKKIIVYILFLLLLDEPMILLVSKYTCCWMGSFYLELTYPSQESGFCFHIHVLNYFNTQWMAHLGRYGNKVGGFLRAVVQTLPISVIKYTFCVWKNKVNHSIWNRFHLIREYGPTA